MNKKQALMWFILSILTLNISVLFLGKKLNVYEKHGWYNKWFYWVLGLLFGILPALVMLGILIIEINVKVCGKLNVPGKEIYTLPYVWIGLLIVPVIGWTLFIIMLVYIYIMHIIYLFKTNLHYNL